MGKKRNICKIEQEKIKTIISFQIIITPKDILGTFIRAKIIPFLKPLIANTSFPLQRMGTYSRITTSV